MRVRDLMTTDVLSVTPETPLKDVGQLLADRRISGIPVVDGAGRVLGVVSEADILLKQGEPAERRRGVLAWLVARENDADDAKLLARNQGGVLHLRLVGDGRCIALRGAIGRRVRCSIYALRPAGCRRVEPGDRSCLRYRAEAGLA